MGKYLFTRLIHMVITLIAMLVLMFFLFRLMPGDPTAMVISDALYPKAQAAMMEQFGLDKPLHQQFLIYLKNYAQFDFGISFRTNRSVAELIEGRLMNTIMLILPSMIAAYVMGIIIGALMAWWRGGKAEFTIVFMATAFQSAPVFWVVASAAGKTCR